MSNTRLIPTPRLLLLVLIPPLLWTVSGSVRFLVFVGWLALFTVVALIIYDIRNSIQAEQIHISREHNRKLSIRENNPVALIIRNDSPYQLTVNLKDGVPFAFRGGQLSKSLSAELEGFAQKRLNYQIKPTRRGEYGLGPVVVRWLSNWKFFYKQARFPVFTDAKVYPSLLQIKLYEQLIRKGNSMYAGSRRYNFSGDAGEFEQLRDYLPDDDYRRISWTATAKYGRPITMEFSPERAQNIMLVVDTGRRMLSRPLGEARTTRLDLIINAVLMFSYVALSRADRVGLLTFDKKVHRYLSPQSGMGQFYRLVESMHDVEASLDEPDYGNALRFLQANRQNRSMVLMMTDPTGQEAAQGLIEHLGAFYPRHLPICVVLSDPAVLDAAGRRPYSLDAIYQRAVADQIIHERQLWLSRLNQRGVQTLDVPAYELTASVINRYLELKDSGRF